MDLLKDLKAFPRKHSENNFLSKKKLKHPPFYYCNNKSRHINIFSKRTKNEEESKIEENKQYSAKTDQTIEFNKTCNIQNNTEFGKAKIETQEWRFSTESDSWQNFQIQECDSQDEMRFSNRSSIHMIMNSPDVFTEK